MVEEKNRKGGEKEDKDFFNPSTNKYCTMFIKKEVPLTLGIRSEDLSLKLNKSGLIGILHFIKTLRLHNAIFHRIFL